MLRNIKETGYPFQIQLYKLMSRNVLSLGFSDLAMVLSTGISLPFAKLFRNGPWIFQWRNGGWWLQSIYELGWLALWTQWPFLLAVDMDSPSFLRTPHLDLPHENAFLCLLQWTLERD